MQLAKTEVLRGIFTFLLCSMANNGGSSIVQTFVKLQGKKINFAVKYEAKFSNCLVKIRNHNMLMVVMTPPDCLKWPETSSPPRPV